MRNRNIIYISLLTFLLLGIYITFTSHSPDKIFAEEKSSNNYNKDIFLSKLSKLLNIDKSELEDAINKTKLQMSKEKPTDYAPNKKTYLRKEIKKALINGEITLKQAKIKYMSIDKNFTNKNIDKNYKKFSDLKKNILKLLSQGKITEEEAKDKIEFLEKKFSYN